MTQISSEPAHNAATLNDEVTLALRAIYSASQQGGL